MGDMALDDHPDEFWSLLLSEETISATLFNDAAGWAVDAGGPPDQHKGATYVVEWDSDGIFSF